jgi:transcriptional regulator with XRE-family HTH domain
MKKSPNDADRHIGSQIKARRNAIGMSQEKLGDMLGLTFSKSRNMRRA